MKHIANGFELFMTETDGVGKALFDSIKKLNETSSLEPKVQELAYIAVLVAMKMYDGLPFHMKHAKELGSTKEEIKSAMLVSMPLVGIQVAQALPYLNELDIE